MLSGAIDVDLFISGSNQWCAAAAAARVHVRVEEEGGNSSFSRAFFLFWTVASKRWTWAAPKRPFSIIIISRRDSDDYYDDDEERWCTN